MTQYLLRGIGERQSDPNNMCMRGAHLVGAGGPIVDLPWGASYGSPVPFGVSVDEGAELLAKRIRSAPAAERLVVWSYSGGCVVVHRAMRLMSPVERARVRAWVFVSDPEQPELWLGDTPVSGIRTGLASAQPLPADVMARCLFLCDPRDGICCCPRRSPLRWAAQWSENIGLGDRRAWDARIARAMLLARAPAYVADWRNPGLVRAEFERAGMLIHGYLRGGDHTSYGTRKIPGTSETYLARGAGYVRERLK